MLASWREDALDRTLGDVRAELGLADDVTVTTRDVLGAIGWAVFGVFAQLSPLVCAIAGAWFVWSSMR